MSVRVRVCVCVCLEIPMLKPDNAMKIQDLLRKRKENSRKKIMRLSSREKKLNETFHLELSAASENLFFSKTEAKNNKTDLRTTTATVNTADSRLMRDEDDKY